VELDALGQADGRTDSADVCIVGAGPLGLSLAQALLGHGRTIILVESGGSNSARELADLNAGQVTGDTGQVLEGTRYRAVGGTAATWNTALFGAMSAKYVALDPIDFESRRGLHWSGWPITRTTLADYIARAAQIVGTLPIEEAGEIAGARRQPMEFAAGGLVSGCYSFGRPEVFTESIPARLRAAGNVLLMRGATVTGISPSAGRDRVAAITWRTLSGNSGTVRASTYVLASGGIENARLLLAATDFDLQRRGHRHWLGRGYMEHPVDESLRLTTARAELCPTPGYYEPHGDGGGRCIMGRIGLSEGLLQHEQLPNASLRLIPEFVTQSRAARRVRAAARRLRPGHPAGRLLDGLARGVQRWTARPGPCRYRVLVDLEQPPHPDNRVTLTDDVDRLGMRRVRLHWTWGDQERTERQRVLDVISRELERGGTGAVERLSDPRFTANSCHHLGTTRMHADPEQGVVDANLRLHGVENLYVTGSSVFPTGGWANPTMTALALTLRLADHLCAQGRATDARQ
jgi:choline dehydrogenase-like flavoprotein